MTALARTFLLDLWLLPVSLHASYMPSQTLMWPATSAIVERRGAEILRKDEEDIEDIHILMGKVRMRHGLKEGKTRKVALKVKRTENLVLLGSCKLLDGLLSLFLRVSSLPDVCLSLHPPLKLTCLFHCCVSPIDAVIVSFIFPSGLSNACSLQSLFVR